MTAPRSDVRRRVLALAALAVGCGALPGCGPAAPPAAHPPVPAQRNILWDTWGIPHVYGRNDADVAYGFAQAQMQSHGDLLLRLYAQARGCGAEYLGEAALALDRWVRTMGVPARAAAWYAAQTSAERALIDAFAAGINDYATAYPDRIAPELRGVLPVSPTDVLAHVQRVVDFTFVASPLDAIAQVEGWSKVGSNGWAIAPSRSASHHALLLGNPHLPWGDLFTFYEAQLVAPDLDVYGVTFVGFPVVAIGFTSTLAWTHTANTYDGVDLYELQLAPGGYLVDGAPRAFEVRDETVRVRQADGTLRDEKLTIHASIHGPVIGMRGDRALAARVAGLDAPHLVGQYLRMAQAQDLAAFEAAVAELQLPVFNVVYADRAGHILEVFNGRVPRRAEGDAAFWAGIVPGTRSELIWNQTLDYAELPRMVDPPTGWLQNSNDPPWTMTLPGLAPSRFPPYLAPTQVWHYRTQRSIEMIRADAQMTLDQLIRDKFSTRLELADRLLDDLLPAARKGGALAQQAARVLESWDRTADAASKGGVLFAAWAKKYLGPDTFTSKGLAVPWRADAPVTTPRGLADPARAVAALEEAAQEVMAAHGALDVAWGEVHRIRHAGLDLPASGADDQVGSFASAWYSPATDGKLVLESGDTFVEAVELGDPVRARALLGYGNASQAGSPHRTDQLPLLQNRQLRDVWRTRAEVEQHVERRETY